MLLAHKVAIVTGAARGIGKATAMTFARHGADVALVDIQETLLHASCEDVGRIANRARGFSGDLTKPEDVRRVIGAVLEHFDHIDILANVAGGNREGAVGMDTSEEDFEFEVALNVKTAFLCCQAVIPHMKKRRYGKIVNIISEAGRHRATMTGLGYVAGKAGGLGLTRRLAWEVGPFNITVNAVSPGNVLSELGRQQYEDLTPERQKQIDEETPLRRWAEPEELANAILFMASDLSSFVTGATLSVSGGRYMI
jgi:3-oxoacyl-[acyl-carrier protein] reductase